MTTIIKRIEYLKKLAVGIELNVRSKITDEIEEMFISTGELQDLYKEPRVEDLLVTIDVLKEALRDAKKEFKEAKKSMKEGRITEDELISYKRVVNDIMQQIRDIEAGLK